MAFIELHIEEPKNNAAIIAAIVGATAESFRGSVNVPPEAMGIALYYRWYSSLNTKVKKDKYSMNTGALTSADAAYTHPTMDMGSHVITFAASDRQGEQDEDFQAMEHGGVTGGEKGESRCVIHVFKSNILAPQTGASISRANVALTAEAPSVWGNINYHAYNRLSFRWTLEPLGEPSGRSSFDSGKLTTEPTLAFFNGDGTNLPRVIYRPVLPVRATGDYKITLLVGDVREPGIGDQQSSINVSIIG